MKQRLSVLLILLFLLTGCQPAGQEPAATPDEQQTGQQHTDQSTAPTVEEGPAWSQENAVTVQLAGKSATASHTAAKVAGSVITLTQAGTYVVSGTLDNGSLVVDAPKTAVVRVVLNGACVTNATGAALSVLGGKQVFVTLADGSANALVNGGSFADTAVNGALYAKQDLTLEGPGSLTVTSPAGHGITGKDRLAVTGGQYTVNAAFHGLDANDQLTVTGGTFAVTAGKDGLHAENTADTTQGNLHISNGTFQITAAGDGISAGNTLQITGGAFEIVTGGGAENGDQHSSDNWGAIGGGGMGRPGQKPGYRTTAATTADTTDDSTSMKGLKSGGKMTVSGGTFVLNCADDGFHSDQSLLLEKGSVTLATGDDGLHAEEDLTISGGTVEVTECYEGLEALNITVSGGNMNLTCTDDGLNAAGGNDNSGTQGGRDGMFGGRMGPGGMAPGGMGGASNGSVTISGGTLYIKSSGDGIDANGSLAITGGHTTVVGPTRGDTATLDYDNSATISGGTFIGSGASGMAQSFGDSDQGVVAFSVGNQAANTAVTITDSAGKTLLTYAPALDFAVVIYSDPAIVKGQTYNVQVGTSSGSVRAN